MNGQETLGSWLAVDLTPYLDGDIRAEMPTICPRDDNVCLFYLGRTHSVAGEPESGKTWLALHAVLRELEKGTPVLYLDFEDHARSICNRLRQMGATKEMLAKFTYVRPTDPLPARRELFYDYVAELRPSLIIIDGVTVAMTAEDLSIVSNDDVAEFTRLLATPLARLGAAVVSLDHVVKKRQDRGRNAIGAAHKLASITGAAYHLERLEPFTKGRTGRSRLYVSKDREGEVRRHAQAIERGEMIAVLQVSTDGDGTTLVQLDSGTPAVRVASRMDKKKVEILDQMGDLEFPTLTAIKQLVGGSSQVVSDALRDLIKAGLISREKPYKRLT